MLKHDIEKKIFRNDIMFTLQMCPTAGQSPLHLTSTSPYQG